MPLTPGDEISVEDLARYRREGVAHTLLDVRERAEVAAAALDGALHIPMAEVPERLAEIPAGPVVVLCHHGMRSRMVTDFLLRQGHGQAQNLAGGIDAWSLRIDPAVPRY